MASRARTITSASHGRRPSSAEQQHRGVDHEAVGERVRELPELGLDVPATREEPVDLIGEGRGREEPGEDVAPLTVGSVQEHDEDRDDEKAQDRERIRQLCERCGNHAGRHSRTEW